MSEKPKVNRRQFIKAAGLTAAASSFAAGIDVSSAVAAPPRKWDEETDVVVVGYGGAGAVTAINAADNGAQVIVLEKNPGDAHVCNTNLNGGQFISPTDVEKGYQYIKACIGDTVDDDMCHLWSELTTTNRDYIMQLAKAAGADTKIVRNQGAEFPDLPGADGISTWNLVPAGGWYIFDIYHKNVQMRKNIKIAWGSPGKKLVQDPNTGEILGVICERNGKEVSVRGRRATVLSSGGYEFNNKLKVNSLFGNPRYFGGTESNTGDGIVMAMAVGADLWHMNWTSQHIGGGSKMGPGGGLNTGGRHSWIMVDQYGKRYMNEDYNGHSAYLYLCQLDPVRASWSRLPSYFIGDDTLRADRLSEASNRGNTFGVPTQAANPIQQALNNWHAKRQVSVEEQIKRGVIVQADTIPDLVKAINARQCPNQWVEYPSKIKMDAATLQATVDTYNTYAKAKGVDTKAFEGARNPLSTPGYTKEASPDKDFGRRLMQPIEKPPFYAHEMWPNGPNTQGGPRFDTKGRVISTFGQPIPRLYKCGELGSVYGQQYPAGGGNNAEIMAYGRLVGKNAAEEKPQKS